MGMCVCEGGYGEVSGYVRVGMKCECVGMWGGCVRVGVKCE